MRIVKLTITTFLLALIIVIGASFAPTITYADDTAAKALATDQQLLDNEYAFKSDIKLTKGSSEMDFYIPVSYYVFNPTLVIANYYQVTYLGETYYIDGSSINAEQITKEDGVEYYPNVTLTIKDESNVTISGTQIDNTYEITFFGYNEDSSKIFVKAVNQDTTKFGFINKEDLNPFNVPYQVTTQAARDILVAQKAEQDAIDAGYFKTNTSYALRIIIIVVIAIPLVIFTLFIFKRNKNIKVQQQLTSETKQDEQ